MSLSNIAEFVSKTAPLLGSVIGGPIGGTVGMALSLIANKFGANPKSTEEIFSKMTTDPDAVIKLKELELEHQESLFQIKSEMYAKEVDDRIDAREFNIAYLNRNGSFPPILWFLIVMLFFSIGACIWAMVQFSDLRTILAMFLTACIYEFKSVYKLFTGGSMDDSIESKN